MHSANSLDCRNQSHRHRIVCKMSHLGTGSLCDESMALENLPSSAHPHSLSEELILQDVAAGSERSLALDQNSLASGINDNLDGELDSLYV